MKKQRQFFLSFRTTHSPNDNSISLEIDKESLAKYGNADTGNFRNVC